MFLCWSAGSRHLCFAIANCNHRCLHSNDIVRNFTPGQQKLLATVGETWRQLKLRDNFKTCSNVCKMTFEGTKNLALLARRGQSRCFPTSFTFEGCEL
eukprot:763051-Hanusia_phi.AAC.4